MGDAGPAQPELRFQDLVESVVGNSCGIRCRKNCSNGEPADDHRVPAWPEPANGEHFWDKYAGPFRHERQVRLVLDLLDAIEDESGS